MIPTTITTNNHAIRTTRRRRFHHQQHITTLIVILSPYILSLDDAFVPHSPTINQHSLNAKRSKGRRDDDLNNWYDDVDDNATPGGVFWEEMERQRLFNQLGGDPARDTSATATLSSSSTSSYTSSSSSSTMFETNGLGSTATSMRMPDPTAARKAPTMDQLKSAEATLSEYTLYQVSDNWLDENLQAYFQQLDSLKKEEPLTLEEETRRLEEQLEALPDGIGPARGFWDNESEEPWDNWGEDDTIVDLDRANTLEVPKPSQGRSEMVVKRTYSLVNDERLTDSKTRNFILIGMHPSTKPKMMPRFGIG